MAPKESMLTHVAFSRLADAHACMLGMPDAKAAKGSHFLPYFMFNTDLNEARALC